MRFQLLFTIATIFSSVALGTDEKKSSETVKKSVIEMTQSIKAQANAISPPPILNPDGGLLKLLDPDHAWIEEKTEARFPKISETYKKLGPELADDAKNWDITLGDIQRYQVCEAAFNLFYQHARLVNTILKYYSSLEDAIKEIKTDMASFQKQCEAFDSLIVEDLDAHTEHCVKTHQQLKSAKSLVEKLLKIGSTSVELR